MDQHSSSSSSRAFDRARLVALIAAFLLSSLAVPVSADTVVTNPDLPGAEVIVPDGALGNNVSLEILPIAALPKSFPRFHTPVAGLVAATSRPTKEFNELLPVCFGNPDLGLGILEEGQVLELFGYDDKDGSWGALGELIVTNGQICSPEPEEGLPAEVGLAAEGIYLAGVRNLDVVGCEVGELAEGLGGGSPAEPTGIFCNALTERTCKLKCSSLAVTKGALCTGQYSGCRSDCRDLSAARRPACFAVCTTEFSVCTAQVSTENLACRSDCNCD